VKSRELSQNKNKNSARANEIYDIKFSRDKKIKSDIETVFQILIFCREISKTRITQNMVCNSKRN